MYHYLKWDKLHSFHCMKFATEMLVLKGEKQGSSWQL